MTKTNIFTLEKLKIKERGKEEKRKEIPEEFAACAAV